MIDHSAPDPQVSPTGPSPKGLTEWVGDLSAGLFSVVIIYVIAFTTLDEALARFGAVGVSVFIVALTQPSLKTALFRHIPRVGWAFDGLMLLAFAFSGWRFFRSRHSFGPGSIPPPP